MFSHCEQVDCRKRFVRWVWRLERSQHHGIFGGHGKGTGGETIPNFFIKPFAGAGGENNGGPHQRSVTLVWNVSYTSESRGAEK